MARERVPLDPDDLRQRYEQGHSVLKMARELDTSRPTIVRKLAALGLEPRSASEANRLRMAGLSAQERRALAASANRARRGEVKLEPRSTNRAGAAVESARSQTRLIGRGEPELADLLIRRGITVECQLPVHGYNIDIAVRPVAVEVWWGEGYPLRHGRQARRVIDLASVGWSTVLVWLSRKLPTGEGADAVITFLEEVSRSPDSIGPQYRVVRGDGQVIATGKADRDHLALVPTSEHGTY